MYIYIPMYVCVYIYIYVEMYVYVHVKTVKLTGAGSARSTHRNYKNKVQMEYMKSDLFNICRLKGSKAQCRYCLYTWTPMDGLSLGFPPI